MSKYDFQAIEKRWQERWQATGAFRAPNPGQPGFDPSRPKYYVLDMFPYPSGVGLHVGHPLGYIATDIVARHKRMKGFNVLHPMGFDAFGLPAEQFAVEHGVHPAVTTRANVENMLRQLKALGLSYDWDRCLSTTDVEYYRWTQWIFLQLFNSWFDPAAQKARPIADLLRKLESGEMDVDFEGDPITVDAQGAMDAIGGGAIGARRWYELSAEEKRQVLDDQRLAYLAEVPVNWCPALGTVLANEEVTKDGRSERGNHPVYKRPLKQWMLRITAYGDRLAGDLESVDWPEPIKKMQRDWIGRSEGAMVDFTLDGSDETIRVFTTRPDTLFGATYMVLAPEHPLVDDLTPENHRSAVEKYRAQTEARTDIDRMAEGKAKTGVFTGAFAVNPVNGRKIPIWIADYVLMGYGTGAIMAVPAHDDRDFEFAKTFSLPILAVVMPDEAWLKQRNLAAEAYLADASIAPEAFTGQGLAVNSKNDEISLNDLPTDQAKKRIAEWLAHSGLGAPQTQYKLRDWLFSRQRYWGEPFPILHGPDGQVEALDESELPVALPEMADFRPVASSDPDAPPQPPLGRAPESWRHVQRGGQTWTRELNTMPQWAGSCWYYLRYLDNRNDQRFVGADAERYWMCSKKKSGQLHSGGVDLYVGGAEHAVLHLLYSRFWHKVLFDLGHVSTPEPFGRLFNQGYIQAYAYQDERGMYVDATKIEERDGGFYCEGKPVTRSLGKMGKSLKNAVSPDEMCAQYGCDTLRLYEMYLGPLDASKPWNTRDIIGVHRFLQRVWRNYINDETGELKITDDAPAEPLLRLVHRTIRRCSEDMDRMSFNTVIAALIELNNELVGLDRLPRLVAETFLLLLAPLAPHIAQELWSRIGCDSLLAAETYPVWDEQLLVENEIELVVQILGKVRGHIRVPAAAPAAEIEKAALADPRIQELLAGKTVKKVILVPGKLINIVAG